MALSNDIDARELARRRSAIYAGLRAYLSEDEALQALFLWEAEFSAGPVFASQGFLSRVCADSGLRARRGEVHKALVRALSLDADQLPPDPQARMQTLAQSRGLHRVSQAAESDGRELAVVLESVLGGLLEALEDHDPMAAQKVRMFVIEHLGPLGLSAPTYQGLTQWLTLQGPARTKGIARTAAQQLVHLAYVAACQYVGPVVTDRLLSAAVTQAEGLPEARRVSPRELL